VNPSLIPAAQTPSKSITLEFLPALGAKIIDILNADIRLPSVIPAPFFVIPVKTGIQTIRQLRCGTHIHNINLGLLKFPKTSFAGFH
jgi:hypothetical protein